MNDNPFEGRDHGRITRAEVYESVRRHCLTKFPGKTIETIVLPGLESAKDSRPGYVLFKQKK